MKNQVKKTEKNTNKLLKFFTTLTVVCGIALGASFSLLNSNKSNATQTPTNSLVQSNGANSVIDDETIVIPYATNVELFKSWGIDFGSSDVPTANDVNFTLVHDSHIPSSEWSIEIYTSSSAWESRLNSSIHNMVCHRLIHFGIDNYLIGELNFCGLGRFHFDSASTVDLGTLTIEDNITTIWNECFKNAHFSGDLVLGNSVSLISDNAFRQFGVYDASSKDILTHNLTIMNGAALGYDVFQDSLFDGILTLGNVAESRGGTGWGDSIFSGCNFDGIVCEWLEEGYHRIAGESAFRFRTYNSGTHNIQLIPGANISIELFKPLDPSCWILEKEDSFKIQATSLNGTNGWSGFTEGWITCSVLSFGNISIDNTNDNPAVDNLKGVNISIGSLIHYKNYDWHVAKIGDSMFYNGIYSQTAISGTLTFANNDSLTTIGMSAFRDCTQLTGSLVLPPNINIVSQHAFENAGFTGTLTLPNSLNTIDHWAFSNTKFTGNLVLPYYLTTLGDGAFSGCTAITTLTIDSNLMSTGASAFAHMNSVTDLYTQWMNNYSVNIPYNAFYDWANTGYLHVRTETYYGEYLKQQFGLWSWTVLTPTKFIDNDVVAGRTAGNLMCEVISPGRVAVYADTSTNFTANNLVINKIATDTSSNQYNVSEIDRGAFDATTTTTITGTVSIGTAAVPSLVTTIDSYAFNNQVGITGIDFSNANSINYIGDYAFKGCKNITGNLQLPTACTSVGIESFYGCSGFNGTLNLDDKLLYIGNGAFQLCSGLIGNLDLKNISELGQGAFANDTGLHGVLKISSALVDIPRRAFYNCSGLVGDIIMPQQTETIGDYAFFNCSSLDGTITFPKWINSIGDYAFAEDHKLTGSISLPPSLTTIGNFAFQNCTSINGSLNINDNVRFIGEGAFLNLTNLSEIHLDWSTTASTIILDEAFLLNTQSTAKHYVYLPANSRVNFADLNGLDSNVWSIATDDAPVPPTSLTPVWIAVAVLSALTAASTIFVVITGVRKLRAHGSRK